MATGNNRNRNTNSQRNRQAHPSGHGKRKKKRVPNYGRILGCAIPLVLVICVIIFFVRLIIWDKGVEYIMTPEDYNNIKLDTKDNVILMPPGKVMEEGTYDGKTSVLIFGNDSYYEGCKEGNGIIDQLQAEVPDVEIYNCCLPGSQLCCYPDEDGDHDNSVPENFFTLFWLAYSVNWGDFSKQREALGSLDAGKYDISRYKDVLDTLENLDIESIEVVMFCYDGHDYVAGNLPIQYVGEDAKTEDVCSVLGSVYTSIYTFNEFHPSIQYVFVCPAFCYAKDEKGKNVSCAIQDTGYGTIEETFNAARLITNYYGMSYVDMYSGVLINEDNANHYLEKDGITPNKKAREMIADRLVTLLKERL